jgi:hypothetical protein
MTIVLDGIAYPMCQDVPIKPGALVYSTEHQVQMNYDFSS